MSDKYKDMNDEVDIPEPDPISEKHQDSDRGEPSLKMSKRKSKKSGAMKVIAVMAVVTFALVAAILYFLISSTSGSDENNAEAPTLDIGGEGRNPIAEMQESLQDSRQKIKSPDKDSEEEEPTEPPKKTKEQKAKENADRLLGQNNAAPAPEPGNGDSDELTPSERKMQGDILIGGDGGAEGGASGNAQQVAANRQGGMPGGGQSRGSTQAQSRTGGSSGSGGSRISSKLQGETYQPGSVRRQTQLDMLLRRGTVIPCVIQNKIVSTHPSLSSCRITKDVYSADGSTVLIERGSIAYGEQKVALLKGQARLFVTWNEIDTAGGVRVRIDSLGVDPLGASGVNAWVDNHFWEKFGGAIMLSFVDDGMSALASRLEKSSGEDVTFNSSTKNANDMAEIALENSINIKPTGYVNQGTRMSIRVSRDVDFSSVYEVEVAP